MRPGAAYPSGMSLSRLSDKSLAQARNGAWATAYDRATVTVGVVHLGPGAFHRAHQAPVFDRLLASDQNIHRSGTKLLRR